MQWSDTPAQIQFPLNMTNGVLGLRRLIWVELKAGALLKIKTFFEIRKWKKERCFFVLVVQAGASTDFYYAKLFTDQLEINFLGFKLFYYPLSVQIPSFVLKVRL